MGTKKFWGNVPILDTINKVPGGLMVIPLFLGVVCNSLIPGFLEIGSFTTALFKNGSNALIATLFFCSGEQIQFKSAGQSRWKGLVLNTSKVLFGVSLGVILAKIGGPGAVVLGMTPLALIGLYVQLQRRPVHRPCHQVRNQDRRRCRRDHLLQ